MYQKRGAGRTANQAQGGSAKQHSPLTDLLELGGEELTGAGLGIPPFVGPVLKTLDKVGREVEKNIKKQLKKQFKK